MNIFVIRHGQSTKNAGIAPPGQKDCAVRLSPKGEQQATQCGKLLKQICEDNHFNLNSAVIFASPYFRAQQTAKFINQSLHLPIKTIYSLCEYQKGIDVKDYRPDQNNALLNRLYNNSCNNIDLNESAEELYLRTKVFIKQLKNLNCENVFVVSHYGFIRALNLAMLNKPASDYHSGEKVKNCSIRQYEYDGNQIKLIQIINPSENDLRL